MAGLRSGPWRGAGVFIQGTAALSSGGDSDPYATLTVLGALENGILNLHPGAQAGTVFACIIVYAIAYLWYQELLKAPEEKATG